VVRKRSELENKIKIFASEKNWIEGEALRQLEKTAELHGMVSAVAMPDIHPGRGNPIGAAFITQGIIYPYLVGNDVGCGVGFFKTGIKRSKIKRDKWVKKLAGLESPWEADSSQWLLQSGIESGTMDHSLGTIGGGNHFAELQLFEKIYDQNLFDALKLDKNILMMLIHSGSRGIGDSVLRHHTEKYGAGGLDIDSQEAALYLKQHDYALKWAAANRHLIAYRMAEQLGGECLIISDVCHNSISRIESDKQSLWLHRKGAAASDCGAIVIPGSRGSLSYLVMPTGDQQKNAWSLAHGAGRKWNRSSTKERLKERFTTESLIRTDLGSYVICEDKDLLFEEAPQAYKNIDVVIDDMVQAGLISVIAGLKPLITYKVRQT